MEKKINDKIEKLEVLDTIKANEEQVFNMRVSREEFEQRAKSSLQQVEDLIARHRRIDAAIIASNAETTIETTQGTFTVAGAIALRNRLRGIQKKGLISTKDVMDFEGNLYEKLLQTYQMNLTDVEKKNHQLQAIAENMRLSILGKDTKGDKPLAVVEAYIKENTVELVDPLDVKRKMELMKERKDALLNELETCFPFLTGLGQEKNVSR